ncbi:MAG: hypothetical protein RLZZ244_236 [Verrucomicrobiota bacterium]|jgi:Zn-finger nucleic acid-binding protein
MKESAGRGKGWLRAVGLGMLLGWGMVGGTGCMHIHAPHAESKRSAVMCDRCKTTWVVRGDPSGKMVRYTRERAMVCPDCETAVAHWMRTGELKHHCAHCRGKLTCEEPQSKGAGTP